MPISRCACLTILLALTSPVTAQTLEKRITPVDANVRQTFERQPKIAVLVGVGAYPEGSGLAPLKYAAQDVAELSSELEKQGLRSAAACGWARPSRGLVVRTLTQIGQVLDPDQGTLLFYFSGHGFTDHGVNYLATYGVTVDDLDREGLSITEVGRLVKATRAKRQVLWIDACRNDPGAGARDVSRRSFEQLNAAEGIRILYSTRAGSVSFEDDSLQHGVFSYFLLRGLRGEAVGSDGLVTFQDLAGYVSDAVMNYGIKTGRIQRPFDAGEASGDFLLAEGTPAGGTLALPVNPELRPAPATTPTAIRPGSTKVNPKDGLTYLWIPPGTFTMGCSPGDNECYEEERPAHQATLTNGFWMSQTPVTQEAYQRVIGTNPSSFKGPRLPVETVNWIEAQAYCAAAGMRLPTEAEWEYAARAGDITARYGPIDSVAWYSVNSGKKTHEVGQKQANGFGLFDMLGNVLEWVADRYGTYSPDAITDPRGPASAQTRVLRGGSWGYGPRVVRVSYRYGFGPGDRYVNIGFRCVGE